MVAPLIAAAARSTASVAGRSTAAGLKNAKRVSVDGRRTRPTTSERYLSDVKQGTDAYRSVRREKKKTKDRETKNEVLSQDLTETPVRQYRTPRNKTVMGPVQQNVGSVIKKSQTLRASWTFIAFGFLPYLWSVFFALISVLGLIVSVWGESTARDIWLIGEWLSDWGADGGLLLFLAFWPMAALIQIILLFGISFYYFLNNIKWARNTTCFIMFCVAFFCTLAPVIQLFPATLVFMFFVLKNTE